MRFAIALILFAIAGCGRPLSNEEAYAARRARVGPPVVVPLAEGGALVCDPFDHAVGYRPAGGAVLTLNEAAERRAEYNDAWLEMPLQIRANTPPELLESLKKRAESLC